MSVQNEAHENIAQNETLEKINSNLDHLEYLVKIEDFYSNLDEEKTKEIINIFDTAIA